MTAFKKTINVRLNFHLVVKWPWAMAVFNCGANNVQTYMHFQIYESLAMEEKVVKLLLVLRIMEL